MKESENSSNRNRRSVLRTMGVTATMGSVGLSSMASADITDEKDGSLSRNTGEKEVTLSRNIRNPTPDEKDAIINSDKLEKFVKSINIPKSGKIAKGKNIPMKIKEMYLDEQKVGETVQIQTKYGEIISPIDNGSLESLVLNIDVDEVPPGRRKQYSGGVGIPTGSSAFITYPGEESPLIFAREATEEEKSDILPQIDRSEKPQNLLVVTTSSGNENSDKLKLTSESEIWAQFADLTYKFDFTTREEIDVEENVGLFAQPSNGITIQATCSGLAAACGIDLVTAYPNCIIAGAGCSISTVAAGGCLLIVLSICAPGGAMAVLDCYTWKKQCT